MNEIVQKIECFNLATKIPCVLYDAQDCEIARFAYSITTNVSKHNHIRNFKDSLKSIREKKDKCFLLSVVGNLVYIVAYVARADCKNVVVAGPIILANDISPINPKEVFNLPICTISQAENFGKMLFCLISDSADIGEVKSFCVEVGFNPFMLEEFFVDSRDYLKDIISDKGIKEHYKKMTLAMKTYDREWVKNYLRQLVEVIYPEPVATSKKVTWTPFRVKQNTVINFFAVFNYIIVEQSINSDFQIYISSLVVTEFERCKNEIDLLVKSYELIDHFFDSIEKESTENKIIRDVCSYIKSNKMSKLSLEEVAKTVNITPKYLSKLFLSEMKIGFKEYVVNDKISYAKDLLKHTDRPIADIGFSIGVDIPNNFTAMFKKHAGMTPLNYRNSK